MATTTGSVRESRRDNENRGKEKQTQRNTSGKQWRGPWNIIFEAVSADKDSLGDLQRYLVESPLGQWRCGRWRSPLERPESLVAEHGESQIGGARGKDGDLLARLDDDSRVECTRDVREQGGAKDEEPFCRACASRKAAS